MDEKLVIIGKKTFLYKQKAPFIESGYSVFGALEYDASSDKVKCHECGSWFRFLGPHVRQAHGTEVSEYKRIHGFPSNAALVSEGFRAHLVAVGKANEKHLLDSPRHPSVCLETRNTNLESIRRKDRNNRVWSGEALNRRGTCHAQLLAKVTALSERLGRTPSTKDLEANGISVTSLCTSFNVDRLSEVMSLAGVSIRYPANVNFPQRLYSRQVLVEMLRDFWAKHNRLPSMSDINRGLVPYSIMRSRCVGNLRELCREAGLLPVYRESVRAQKILASKIANRRFNGLRAAL